jgi:hypothetical protein
VEILFIAEFLPLKTMKPMAIKRLQQIAGTASNKKPGKNRAFFFISVLPCS